MYVTEHSSIMPWTMKQISCMKTLRNLFFQDFQIGFRRKFNFHAFPNRNQIFKLVKDFEAPGTCEDRRVRGPSPSEPPITMKECASVINNFTLPHLKGPSTERRAFRTHILGFLLTFLVPVWDYIVADPENSFFFPLNKCNFSYSIIYFLWFVLTHFVLKTVKRHPKVFISHGVLYQNGFVNGLKLLFFVFVFTGDILHHVLKFWGCQ